MSPESADLRALVMRAFLEEMGWPGRIHMLAKNTGHVYRTTTV